MSRAPTHTEDCADVGLLDQDTWDAPHLLTATDLFTHGSDGWRRAGFDLDDPEDFR